jgi:hypothetical protein
MFGEKTLIVGDKERSNRSFIETGKSNDDLDGRG